MRRFMRITCSIIRPLGRPLAESRSPGGGDGIMDGLQYLGRLRIIDYQGNHTGPKSAQPIRDDGQHRAALVPRIRRFCPKGAAAGSAGDLHAAGHGAALPPPGSGRSPTAHSYQYGSSGWARATTGISSHWAERVPASPSDSGESARIAIQPGRSLRRLYGLRGLRGTRRILDSGNARCHRRLRRARRTASPASPKQFHAGRHALGARRQNRTVCYKYRARAEDPVYRSADSSRTTGSWEAREIGISARRFHDLRSQRDQRTPMPAGGGAPHVRRAGFSRLSTRTLGV